VLGQTTGDPGVEAEQDAADDLVAPGAEDHVLRDRVDVTPASLEIARGLHGVHAGGVVQRLHHLGGELPFTLRALGVRPDQRGDARDAIEVAGGAGGHVAHEPREP